MLVSCILPTRGRREWAAQAVRVFQSQTYPDKELLILDDASTPSFPHYRPECHLYMTHANAMTVGAKRNALCQHSRGVFIAHIDSDDWSDPERLEQQVRLMQETGRAVVGYNSILFYEECTGRVGLYRGNVLGSSLCYRRDWWERHPYANMNIGEDNDFVFTANQHQQLAFTLGEGMMVARVHPDNTSKKDMNGFKVMPRSALPPRFINASRITPTPDHISA